MTVAYCWRSGEIDVTNGGLPEGTVPLASHPDEAALRDAIETLAVHGHKPGVRLVPGLPTAEMMGEDPVQVTLRFSDRLKLMLQ